MRVTLWVLGTGVFAGALLLGMHPVAADPTSSSTPTRPGINSAEQPLVTAPPQQRWMIGVGGLYTHRVEETSAWAPSLEVNYSPTDRLQLHVLAPMVYDSLRGLASHYGIGDLELGVRYRLMSDDPTGWRPAISFYPLVQVPTGSERKNLGTGRTHVFLPLWFSKTFGPWIAYGGGGYWFNPGPGNKDWNLTSLGVIRVLSVKWSLTTEVFHASSSKIGLPEQTGLGAGARYNVNDRQYLFLMVTRGVQNVRDTNQFTSYIQYVFTF
jgi:hypothetical protein